MLHLVGTGETAGRNGTGKDVGKRKRILKKEALSARNALLNLRRGHRSYRIDITGSDRL